VEDIVNEIKKIRALKKYTSANPIIYRYQERLYRLTRGGYLYIIQLGETNVYKIGISVNPNRRLKELKSKSPVPLRIIYQNFGHDYESIEKYFHWVFRKKRVRGEWFELNQDDIIRIFTSCPINECYAVSRN
jgi:hypothetical protein